MTWMLTWVPAAWEDPVYETFAYLKGVAIWPGNCSPHEAYNSRVATTLENCSTAPKPSKIGCGSWYSLLIVFLQP